MDIVIPSTVELLPTNFDAAFLCDKTAYRFIFVNISRFHKSFFHPLPLIKGITSYIEAEDLT